LRGISKRGIPNIQKHRNLEKKLKSLEMPKKKPRTLRVSAENILFFTAQDSRNASEIYQSLDKMLDANAVSVNLYGDWVTIFLKPCSYLSS
jgi:hypothetical protein